MNSTHLALVFNGLAFEQVVGSNFSDHIVGNQMDNLLDGRGGNDSLFGGTGNDVLHGGTADDVLDGGPDNDVLAGDLGKDTYLGVSSSDIIQADSADSAAFGGLTIRGNLLTEWIDRGRVGGLGFPIGSEKRVSGTLLINFPATADGVYQQFEHGVLFYAPSMGAQVVSGTGVFSRWLAFKNSLGFPLTNTTPLPNGTSCTAYQNGMIVTSRDGKVEAVVNSPALDAMWRAADAYVDAFQNRFNALTGAEQQGLRNAFLAKHAPSGFGLTGAACLGWLEDLANDTVSVFGNGVQWVGERLGNLGVNVVELVKEVIIDLPGEFINGVVAPFADRLVSVGELFGEGKIDQALGGLLRTSLLAVADLEYFAASTILNYCVDFVGGIFGGILFGNPLTKREIDLAHSIFGDEINLTGVSISATGLDGDGLVAGKVIYVGSRDLSNADNVALLAHELTHIWQDTQWSRAGTPRAARELLKHVVEGKDQYRLDATIERSFDALTPEQQAFAVQNWVLFRLGQPFQNGFTGTWWDLQSLLRNVPALFGGNPMAWTRP